MKTKPGRADRLRALSDAVPALLLGAMFISFIVQVFMRYVMNQPVGWTVETCFIAWIWIVLWGQSASAREEDEIRFDIVYSSVRPALRRLFRMIFATFLVVVYAVSLPAHWDYVDFMAIEETSYLDLPFNWVFSVLILFLVVSILRYAWIFFAALTGRDIETSASLESGNASRKDYIE